VDKDQTMDQSVYTIRYTCPFMKNHENSTIHNVYVCIYIYIYIHVYIYIYIVLSAVAMIESQCFDPS
jgi:hypothetical protein